MAEVNNETPIKTPKKDEKLAELVGIILGDGGVYMCGNGTLFPRIGFCSYIPQLRKDFRRSLLILGFKPLKWIMKTKTALYRKEEVFKYKKEIGFNNSKHIKRFKMLMEVNAPVV